MPKSSKIRSVFSRRRALALALIVLVLLAGGWFVYSNRDQTKAGKTSSGGYVNLGPATKAERKEAENHKKDLSSDASDSSGEQTTTTSGKRQVTPLITSIDKSSARGFVQGIIEDGGTCTITLTQGSKTVTKTSIGIADASYTTCPAIELEGAVTPGSWKAVLSYSSSVAEGKTNTRSYDIQ